MTPAQYRRARQARGTLAAVAQRLGVDRGTLIRREQGRIAITGEARLAILALPVTSIDSPPMTAGVSRRALAGVKKRRNFVDASLDDGADLPSDYADFGNARQ